MMREKDVNGGRTEEEQAHDLKILKGARSPCTTTLSSEAQRGNLAASEAGTTCKVLRTVYLKAKARTWP